MISSGLVLLTTSWLTQLPQHTTKRINVLPDGTPPRRRHFALKTDAQDSASAVPFLHFFVLNDSIHQSTSYAHTKMTRLTKFCFRYWILPSVTLHDNFCLRGLAPISKFDFQIMDKPVPNLWYDYGEVQVLSPDRTKVQHHFPRANCNNFWHRNGRHAVQITCGSTTFLPLHQPRQGISVEKLFPITKTNEGGLLTESTNDKWW